LDIWGIKMIELLISLTILHTNLARLDQGLETLKVDPYLTAIAERRVKEVSKDFSHDLSWGKYTNCFKWGENLARDLDDPTQDWLDSPTHKENIMKDWDSMAVAKYKGYTVQLFCGYE
jgi:uncharacterized protein YkwD